MDLATNGASEELLLEAHGGALHVEAGLSVVAPVGERAEKDVFLGDGDGEDEEGAQLDLNLVANG